MIENKKVVVAAGLTATYLAATGATNKIATMIVPITVTAGSKFFRFINRE